MINLSILCLLFSNAVTLRRDMSILFNRIAIIALIYCFLHDVVSLSFINKGVGLHGGLLHLTNITQIFHIFVFIISIFILQLTSFYPAWWSGKLLITWDKLSNSGDLIKFLIPSLIWKFVGGWANHLCMVISQEIIERAMEYRGSKSAIYNNFAVKEQRVYGNLLGNMSSIRCTLKGFERNYQTGIPSNYIKTHRYFSSLLTQPVIINSVDNFKINPWFITGFTDAEGCFTLKYLNLIQK